MLVCVKDKEQIRPCNRMSKGWHTLIVPVQTRMSKFISPNCQEQTKDYEKVHKSPTNQSLLPHHNHISLSTHKNIDFQLIQTMPFTCQSHTPDIFDIFSKVLNKTQTTKYLINFGICLKSTTKKNNYCFKQTHIHDPITLKR